MEFRPGHPASSRKAPQVPEDHRRRRSAPRGSGGLFLSRVTSGTEDFLTEGTYNTRRRPQRAGPCGKAAPGDPPRSRPKSSPPAPSFLRLPGCVGVTLCASPPRLRPSRRMARGVPERPESTFGPSQLPPTTAGRRRRGGRARPGGRRELSLQKSGTDPQKSRGYQRL